MDTTKAGSELSVKKQPLLRISTRKNRALRWHSRYCDWLRAGRFRVRAPVGVRDFFFTPVDTGPGAHPVSCSVGTGVKRPGRGVDSASPFSARLRTSRAVPLLLVCACMACYGGPLPSQRRTALLTDLY
jgi:hypothetical protein